MSVEDQPLAPGLYLVATPIGNLEDITLRALRVLRSVDRIACEDTRQTQKLLNHFAIATPTVSYHMHNERGRADELVAAVAAGGRVAVVSDAGMPGIADPGVAVVQAAIAAGVAVYPVPGANAALSALVASGLDAERFCFRGFLPSKSGERRTVLEELRAELAGATSCAQDGSLAGNPTLRTERERMGRTLDADGVTQVFYETPHRVVEALADVEAVFGAGHRVVLARELTKLHEEFLRGTVSEVRAALAGREVVRGEMVLLLAGVLSESGALDVSLSVGDEVALLMRRDGLDEKEALKRVAKARGMGKSDVYREWQRAKR